MEKELKFFALEQLQKFRGMHIALLGEKIVASGESAKEVLEKASKKHPSKMPVLAFVPEREALVL